MKFVVDECLPHQFVNRLAARGYPDAVHPIHVGLLRARDDQLLRRALSEDRILLTCNAVDFRELLAREPVHPGAVLLEAVERETLWRLLEITLTFLEIHPDPAGYMINRVLEVSVRNGIRPYELLKAE